MSRIAAAFPGYVLPACWAVCLPCAELAGVA